MEFLNDLDILDIVDNGFARRTNKRSNYFDEMDVLTFFQRFRLTKRTVLQVLAQIEHVLEFDNDKNNGVTPINQVLTTLCFYATGAHLSTVADFIGVHTSTASRIVKRVSEVLAGLRSNYIKMPEIHESLTVQNDFYQIASFPRVIGCIDGTHIRIQSPGGVDAEIFRNRKGYFSINVQVVGDSNLKIRDIVARWPGSQHDNTIFNHSNIHARFEQGEFQNHFAGYILCYISGDSGYALRNFLLTPLTNPVMRGEILYNEARIRTRNCIERLFGVIKRRFPVLAYGIRLHVETALSVIVATAVLHNIAVAMNEEEPPLEVNINDLNYLIEMGNIPDQPNHPDQVGNYRDGIINYFHNLP